MGDRIGPEHAARESRCYFTRYADDFFFSTNHSVMPSSLINKDEDGDLYGGEKLVEIFDEEGFKINETKISIKDRSQRQVVTGIVVNEKLNVPKAFVREVRAMLYSWKKHGLEEAEKYWQKNCDFRNRVSESVPRFSWVLQGKINHIGEVKGRNDKVFLSLAKKLALLDDNYKLDPKLIASSIAEEIDMFTEGKTDELHVESALEFFHKKGEFVDLKIKFQQPTKGDGDSALEKLCPTLSALNQRKLTVLLFDRDVQKITDQMSGSATDYKDHGNNVFSLVLPKPKFLKVDTFCIEHCYDEKVITSSDKHGRRLFLANEFDKKTGLHHSEPHIYRINPQKNTLIVDSDVIDITKRANVALSKAQFAHYIKKAEPPFDNVHFEGFRPLFEVLVEMRDKYVQSK
jgi:RNA-directed DNA polymerase